MQNNATQLPDVTVQTQQEGHNSLPLKWVGMEKIGVPAQILLSDKTITNITAYIDVFVSLNTAAKGIHMSRLYLQLKELIAAKPITLALLQTYVNKILESHDTISESSKIVISFDLPLKKKALLSDHFGYQLYPVVISHQRVQGQSQTAISLTVPYSSTCPCSSALAEQLNAQAFDDFFASDTIDKKAALEWFRANNTAFATPHSQRSYAYLDLTLEHGSWIAADEFIFKIEETLVTPVQTAVKRIDEQEFARLNGANPMFCEDAARKIKWFLEKQASVVDYKFKVEHQESLHAHNAVVIDTKY